LLERAGARVIEVPTIRIVPLQSQEIDSAIQNLEHFEWIFFTSVNGVAVFFEKLLEFNLDTSHLPRICTIGPATGEKVREFGGTVSLQPKVFQAEGVLEDFCALMGDQLDGIRILLPRARVAREFLPQQLRELGADVQVIPVYETQVPLDQQTQLEQTLAKQEPDLITFTSSSTVRNFVALAGDDLDLQKYRYAAIGPITADTAREYGLKVVLQPEKSTVPDLAHAIEEYFSSLKT
jgi:uroporphyrinogen III methyltransferase/synthase